MGRISATQPRWRPTMADTLILAPSPPFVLLRHQTGGVRLTPSRQEMGAHGGTCVKLLSRTWRTTACSSVVPALIRRGSLLHPASEDAGFSGCSSRHRWTASIWHRRYRPTARCASGGHANRLRRSCARAYMRSRTSGGCSRYRRSPLLKLGGRRDRRTDLRRRRRHHDDAPPSRHAASQWRRRISRCSCRNTQSSS
jgi:hypothetical protein